MTDWSAIDAHLGRDTQADDDLDRVAVAPDGGAGGWEAFDDPESGPDGGRGDGLDHHSGADDGCDIDIPARAYEIVNYARMHNDAAPPGFKGNREYGNEDGRLPEGGE